MGSRGTQGSGNLNPFIDGIKLCLSDRYQPPVRISLPKEYKDRYPGDIESILDLDYNFRKEEEVLKAYQDEASKSHSDNNPHRSSSPVTANGPSRPAPPRPPPPKAPASK
ncbi:hypothetical protein RvY_12964-2 [Ramazzottius varieornatus]|uniref:UMA domain-containing protein n=1 Tax=Ramazzottius varieornatus TaxID=947166 RepID=A0A1D1VQC9_RAMVA|nr:hypothetical protein RvY_12964-2 [Ramazzottius varieornatus]